MSSYRREDLESYLESIQAIAAHFTLDAEIEYEEPETLGEMAYSIFEYSQEISEELDDKKINAMYDSRNAYKVMEEFKQDIENLAPHRSYDFSSLEAMQLNSLYVAVAKNLGVLEDVEWNSELQPLLVYQDGENGKEKIEALDDLITGIEEQIKLKEELKVQ